MSAIKRLLWRIYGGVMIFLILFLILFCPVAWAIGIAGLIAGEIKIGLIFLIGAFMLSWGLISYFSSIPGFIPFQDRIK